MKNNECIPCGGRIDGGQGVTYGFVGLLVFVSLMYMTVVFLCLSRRAIGHKEWARIDVLIREEERKEDEEKNRKSTNRDKQTKELKAKKTKAKKTKEPLKASSLKAFLASNGIHMTANEMKIVCHAFNERKKDRTILGDLVVGIGESYKIATPPPVLLKRTNSKERLSRMNRLALIKSKNRAFRIWGASRPRPSELKGPYENNLDTVFLSVSWSSFLLLFLLSLLLIRSLLHVTNSDLL